MRKWLVIAALSLFVLGERAAFADSSSSGAPVAASTEKEPEYSPEVRRRAAQIAREVMSPFCPGRTVSDCTSEYAAEWRREILVMVQAGRSSESIVAELSSRAGRDLSGSPGRRLSLGLPLMLSISAGIVLVAVLSWLRGARRERLTAQESRPIEDAGRSVDDARLDSELRAIEDD